MGKWTNGQRENAKWINDTSHEGFMNSTDQ